MTPGLSNSTACRPAPGSSSAVVAPGQSERHLPRSLLVMLTLVSLQVVSKPESARRHLSPALPERAKVKTRATTSPRTTPLTKSCVRHVRHRQVLQQDADEQRAVQQGLSFRGPTRRRRSRQSAAATASSGPRARRRANQALEQDAADRGQDTPEMTWARILYALTGLRASSAARSLSRTVHHAAEACVFEEEPDQHGKHQQHDDRHRDEVRDEEVEAVAAKRQEGIGEFAVRDRSSRRAL